MPRPPDYATVPVPVKNSDSIILGIVLNIMRTNVTDFAGILRRCRVRM